MNIDNSAEDMPQARISQSKRLDITSNTEVKMNEKPEKKSLAFILAYGSVMAAAFIATMDTVIVATALPAIAIDLNARSNEAYWLGSGFLFAQAVSQPLYGTLSAVFGRKACFLFAMIVFTIASVFCATAQSIEWLIVARVVSLPVAIGLSNLRLREDSVFSNHLADDILITTL